MVTIDHLAALLLDRLAWTSLQAAALALVVALLVRRLPRLPAAVRCVLWWLVGMQALAGLAWQAPIRLPLLASHAVTATTVIGPVAATAQVATASATAAASPPPAIRATAAAGPDRSILPWRTALAATWLLLLLAQLPALVVQQRRARRLRRQAAPLHDTGLQTQCVQQSRALGLRRTPRLLASAAVGSPQVSGLWRPVVLWPTDHVLAPADASLALAHELAHLQRGDLLLGWIPALAQRLFFFHPLLRWATHEYALHREAACDALALRQQGVAPQDYGRLLLRLGVAHPLRAGLAGASPTFHNLRRRLTMLQQNSRALPRARSWLLVALVALAGVLPYRVVAANGPMHAVAVQNGTRADTTVPPAPPPPPPEPTLPSPPALPPPPPVPPVPPRPPASGFDAHNVDIDLDSDARQGFALIDDGSVIIQGTQADEAAVKRLQRKNEPMLWYRRAGKAYLIRDKALIARARRIYAPVTELATEQGRLADKQGEIADRQARLATRDAAFARAQGALAQQQAQLATETAGREAAAMARAQAAVARQQARIAQMQASAQAQPDADGLARAQAHLAQAQARLASETSVQQANEKAREAAQRRLEAAQARLEQRHAAEQKGIAAQQRAMQVAQAGLEKQMHTLGQRQQEAAHQAARSMDRLLHDAVAQGLAQEVSNR